MEMEQVRKSFSVRPNTDLGLRLKGRYWGALSVLLLLIFLPFTASAGTLRKPPNNLGLVAYWPFNEGSGSIAGDASGNGHTGTLKGNAAFPTWTSGKLGSALNFDISNNNRATFTNITTGTTNTISAWIYLTSDCVSYGSIFSEDGVEGLYCYKNGGGTNKMNFWYSATPADHFSNTPLALNRWYHVVIVNNAGSATFYLNGVADGNVNATPSFNANTMGGDTLSETLPGKLDEVRFYSRALSASDVYALYKSGAFQVNNSNKSPSTLSTGLTGYWTFDGKDMIQNVADVSGNGRHGSLESFTSTTTAPGKVGQALNFSGAAGGPYVSTVGVTNLMSSATGTISVWLRPTGGTANFNGDTTVYNARPAISCSCIFGSFGISRGNKVDTGEDKIWVWKYSNALIGIPYVTGEWAHITLVHANGTLYAYKNGDLVGSAAAGNFSSFNGFLYIGGIWSGASSRWRGDLDEVRTYNRDLSASEIKQLYNLTLGTKVNKPSVNSLTSGLVGYYTFDGGDTDWSINKMTNRGSLGGTATLTAMSTTTTPTRGKVGQGFSFIAGANSYVNLGTSASLMPGTGNFSASIWVKRNSSSGVNGLIGGRATVFQPYWELREDSATVSEITNSVGKTFTLTNDNEWHHVAMVLDRTPSPDTLTVYLDGVSQGSETGTLDGQNISGAGNIVIGRGSWASPQNFQGSLDEARIYSRTLSAAEVLQLYRQGK